MAQPRRRKPVLEPIYDWSQLADRAWPNLLLGNGFSRAISDDFEYGSLFKTACESGYLSPHAASLFVDDEGEEVRNFEWVLRRLAIAASVSETIGTVPRYVSRLRSLYEEIRSALINTVNDSHVARSDIPRERLLCLGIELMQHERVFTTNYDLIPYWALNALRDCIVARWPPPFVDGFFRSGHSPEPIDFDEDAAEDLIERTPDSMRLFYLHGALHLATDEHPSGMKLVGGQTSILNLWSKPKASWIPLAVTEGTSRAKMLSIESVHYLRWANRALAGVPGNVVVFGHGLDQEADAHIAKALSAGTEGTARTVAVSLYGSDDAEDRNLLDVQAHYRGMLAGVEEILFFKAETHPLSSLSELHTRWLVRSDLTPAAFARTARTVLAPSSGFPVFRQHGSQIDSKPAGFWPVSDDFPHVLLGSTGVLSCEIGIGDRWHPVSPVRLAANL